jgi:hypothetical protein
MKLAKVVFWAAAIWGVLSLTPLYFIFDMIGKKDPPPVTHPAFYYGFVGAGLAWQLAFFVIAKDPIRFRPVMIPAIVEKFSYGIAVLLLVTQGRTQRQDLLFAGMDMLLGLLFIVAYLNTSSKERAESGL